ncbi:MAG: hypothetical protein JOZ49_19355 [Mycolicibacterium sp.]|nr:hypothetical protein [Mycolicibacterium sp.]
MGAPDKAVDTSTPRADPQALGWPVAPAKLAIGTSPGEPSQKRTVFDTAGSLRTQLLPPSVGDVDVADGAHYPVPGKMQSSERQLNFTFQPCAYSFAR